MKRRAREPAVAAERPRQAVIYARVSSKEQEREGYSIDAQLRMVRGYAAEQGLQVVREFVEAETAKVAGRRAYNQMLEHLCEHEDCRIVLVEKTDRLYRNFADYVKLYDLGIETHLVKERKVLSRDSDSWDWTMHEVQVAFARGQIRRLSEETKKGQREKARQGMWPSWAPYGYQNVERDGRRIIEPDPDVAPIIAKLFEAYATGSYSLKELVRFARDSGLEARVSKKAVPKSVIHNILRNPLYYGEFMWDGELYEGTYDPIVSKELWLKVQRLSDRRSGLKKGRTKHDFAFRGLVRCGHCGCALTADIKKRRYVYYHCTGHKGNCGEPYTPEKVLEAQFGQFVDQLQMDDGTISWVADAIREGNASDRQFHETAIRRLERKSKRLELRLDRAYTDKLDGQIDSERFERLSVEWREEVTELERQVQSHRRATEDQSHLENGARILELAGKAHELYRKQNPGEKRRLLEFLVSNCTWKDQQLSAEYRQPFNMLAVTATEHRRREAAGTLPDDLSEIWLPTADSNSRAPPDRQAIHQPSNASPQPQNDTQKRMTAIRSRLK